MAWPHDPTFQPNAEQRAFIHHVRNVDKITCPLVPFRDTFAEVGSFRLMIPTLTTAELGIALSAISGAVLKEFLCSLSDKHFQKFNDDLQAKADRTRLGVQDLEVRTELVRMNAISSELTLAGRALRITLSDALPFKGLDITHMAFDQAQEIEPLFAPPDFERLMMDSLHRIARGENPEDAVPEPKSGNIPFLPTDSGVAIVGIDYGVEEKSEMSRAYAVIQQLMAGHGIPIDSLKGNQVQELIELIRQRDELFLLYGDPNAPKPSGVINALREFDPHNIPPKDGYVEPDPGTRKKTKNRKTGWKNSTPWKR